MKKIILIIFAIITLASCKDDSPQTVNDNLGPVDYTIIGTWKVVYSKTMDSIMMVTNDSLLIIGKSDTIEYNGEPGKEVLSFMFGTQENIIEIKENNSIKIYFINNRGGISITSSYIPYWINKNLLIYNDGKIDFFHHYSLKNDTLIIERIPDEKTSWKYKLSKYIQIEDI